MYVFQADTYCDSCGEAIRAELLATNRAPADPSDERSYDSDDFPKWAPEDDADYPDHCCCGAMCREAIELPGEGKIGALLGGLTDDGIAYLIEMLDAPEPSPYQVALHAYWRETFAQELSFHGA